MPPPKIDSMKQPVPPSADDPSPATLPILNNGVTREVFEYPQPKTTLPTGDGAQSRASNVPNGNGSFPPQTPSSAYYINRGPSADTVGMANEPPPPLGAGGNMAPFSSTKKELLNSQISGGAKRKFR